MNKIVEFYRIHDSTQLALRIIRNFVRVIVTADTDKDTVDKSADLLGPKTADF